MPPHIYLTKHSLRTYLNTASAPIYTVTSHLSIPSLWKQSLYYIPLHHLSIQMTIHLSLQCLPTYQFPNTLTATMWYTGNWANLKECLYLGRFNASEQGVTTPWNIQHVNCVPPSTKNYPLVAEKDEHGVFFSHERIEPRQIVCQTSALPNRLPQLYPDRNSWWPGINDDYGAVKNSP